MEQHLGFSAARIGYISSLVLGTKMVGPYLWGWLADYYGARIRIIRLGAFLAFISFLAVFWRQDFWPLLAIVAFFSFFWNAVLSQFEVVTLSHLQQHTDRYAQVRLWGSVGFIVAVSGLGAMFDYVSIAYLPVALAALLAAIWLAGIVVQEPQGQSRQRVANHMALFWRQLARPGMVAFFLAAFLVQLSHGPYYTFFTIYLESLAYPRAVSGLLWSLGVAAEVVLFVFMHKLLVRYSLRILLLVTLLLTMARWLLIALFAESWPLLVFAQLLHAASFGSFHAVAIEIVRQNFSDASSGQAQAFYSAISFGAGGAIGALASGWLWAFGPTLLFLLAALAVVPGFLAVLFFVRD